MPRSEAQNEVIRDKRRKKILDKSLFLFAIQGFDDITVDDITNESNCSHGLFYHYFDGKEDIYSAIWEIGNRLPNYRAPLEEAKKAGGMTGLHMISRHAASLVDAPREAVALTRCLAIEGFATSTAKLPIPKFDVYEMIVQLVKEAQKSGDVDNKKDPRFIATIFLDAVSGLTYRILTGGKDNAKAERVTEEAYLNILYL